MKSFNNISTRSNNRTSSSNTSFVGRVVRVEKGSNVSDFEGSVLFTGLEFTQDEIIEDQLQRAFPGQDGVRTYPMKGELIEIVKLPSDDLSDSNSNWKYYYTRVIPIFNTPSYNGYPNVNRDGYEVQLEDNLEEPTNINPLRLYSGDKIIEGRLGQSIRLTGFQSPYTDSTNTNQPLILISNGQISTDNGYDLINEDINEDNSSLYFTSNHKISNISSSNSKVDTYNKGTYTPKELNSYQGSQIIGNSDRIVLNSKQDSILLRGKESVGIGGNSVNLDGVEYVGIDGNQVYLGKDAQEPGVKGDTLESILGRITDLLYDISNTMATAPPDPYGFVTRVKPKTWTWTEKADLISKDIHTIKSKKVKVE